MTDAMDWGPFKLGSRISRDAIEASVAQDWQHNPRPSILVVHSDDCALGWNAKTLRGGDYIAVCRIVIRHRGHTVIALSLSD